MDVDAAYINRQLGRDFSAEEMAVLLRRMSLSGESVREGAGVKVSIPPTRSDVLHACDVMEVQTLNLTLTLTR